MAIDLQQNWRDHSIALQIWGSGLDADVMAFPETRSAVLRLHVLSRSICAARNFGLNAGVCMNGWNLANAITSALPNAALG
jgi:hypothetical protein